MKTAQVLIMEQDAKVTAILEGMVFGERKCLLRHPRDPKQCIEWLEGNDEAVLVLSLGRKSEELLTHLASVSRRFPEVASVVVGEPLQGHLAGMAWDLGAAYVLILPQPLELIREVVAGLLRSIKLTG